MATGARVWLSKARRLQPKLRRWRMDLHREPELAGEERATRSKLVGWLRELDIEPRTYAGFHGVSAVIGRDRPGPVVALRADMDGLPVHEETGLPFHSTIPERMHACGHDVHMACLLGAAALLKSSEDRLAGPVTLLFQPAEEEGETGGAGPFIRRGCLDDPAVAFVVGQHVEPGLPAGVVHYRKGPLMAAADHFIIRVHGSGGHAAFPHQGADAIVASSEIVAGLQALVSRRRDPLDPVVVSVGMIHGGTRHNVLPEEVTMEGTVRTFRPETRVRMEALVRERAGLIARSLGARARIEYRRGYPVTVNAPAATEIVARALATELGDASVRELERPVMGAEDFSRYLERVPGTFLFLGAAVPGRPAALHSSRFAPPESILPIGAATLAAAAEGLQRRG